MSGCDVMSGFEEIYPLVDLVLDGHRSEIEDGLLKEEQIERWSDEVDRMLIAPNMSDQLMLLLKFRDVVSRKGIAPFRLFTREGDHTVCFYPHTDEGRMVTVKNTYFGHDFRISDREYESKLPILQSEVKKYRLSIEVV